MAAAPTITITISGPSISGTRALSASKQVSGNSLVEDVIAVPAATDGQLFTMAFKYATIQMAYLLASTDMTVFTNVDGGGSNDTVTLKAGLPNLFVNGGAGANPFAHDVTSIYIDNLGAVAGQLDICVLSQV